MKTQNENNASIDNIILVSFDSLRFDYVDDLTPDIAPNFCKLRDDGASFRNTIVQAPFTIPSHVSMLAGLYPCRTGVRDMHHKVSKTPTLFTILKEQGFATALISPIRMLMTRGFEGIDTYGTFRSKKLTDMIKALNSKRFFALLHYWDIHTPYETILPGANPFDTLLNILTPLDRFKDIRFIGRILTYFWRKRVDRIREMMAKDPDSILPAVKNGYKNSIITADKYLGSVLKIIEKTGVANKTLLIITGDHGDAFNEHNEIKRSVGKRYEHGQFLYDNIIKVPLIFYQPGQNFQIKCNSLVQQIDIAPTILKAAGVDYDSNVDGKSLWDHITDQKTDSIYNFVFTEAVRESLDLELRAVRSENTKLIRDYKNNTFELYDLRSDPDEQTNIWEQEHPEKDTLLSELENFSRLGSDSKSSNEEQKSTEEQQEIEDQLRSLGYID